MKKLFLISFMAIAALFVLPALDDGSSAHAQLTKTFVPTGSDSLVNSQSITIACTPTDNSTVGFHVTGTRASGTVAGYIVIQGSLNGTTYAPGDTVTLVNAANILASLPVTNQLPFVKYRAVVTTTGTSKVTGIRVHVIRRT